MHIATVPAKLFAFMRRRWAAQPKRTLQDWIARLSFVIVRRFVYVTYVLE